MAYVIDPNTNQYVEVPDAAGMPPPQQPEQSSLLRRAIGDPLTAAAKGVLVGIPQTLVGLADLATFGRAGQFLQNHGADVNEMSNRFDKNFSSEHRQQQDEVAATKGFFPTIGAYLQRPGLVLDTAIEQLPTMFAGAKLGQAAVGGKAAFEAARTGAATAAAGDAAVANLGAKAGAIGEGVVTAGQNAEQVRGEAEDGTLTPWQAATQAVAGVVTGGISLGAGKLANKMGITDVDVLMASGQRAQKTAGILERVGKGVFTEGVLEELPQSMQEQIWQNAALGRPLTEGVAEAGAQGLVLGGAMGGTVAGKLHNNRVADAVAGIQTLSQPPQQNSDGTYQTKDHEDALRSVVDLLGTDPARKQELNQWRLDQIAAMNAGQPVSFDGIPELASDSALMTLAKDTVSAMEARRAGQAATPAVVDDFGTQIPGQEEVFPRPFTKQDKAVYDQLQKAIANNDAESIARWAGKLRIPEPQVQQMVQQAAQLTPVPSAAPAAAPAPASVAFNDPTAPAPRADALKALLSEVGGHAGSRASVAKRLEKALPTNATVADLRAAVNAALNDAQTEGNESRVKILTALAAQLGVVSQGGTNESANVNQGAESQPAAGQANAAISQPSAQGVAEGNAASQPAQETAQVGGQRAIQEPSATGVDVQPAASHGKAVGGGNPQGGQAASQTGDAQAKPVKKTKQQQKIDSDAEKILAARAFDASELEAKDDAALGLLEGHLNTTRAALQALLGRKLSPEIAERVETMKADAAEALVRVQREQARRNASVQQTTQALQAPATPTKAADVERLLPPAEHWEAKRKAAAEKAGAPLKDFFIPAYDQLPEKARKTWEKSERQGADFKAAWQAHQQERASETARSVGTRAAIEYKSEKDWIDRVNQAHDLMKRLHALTTKPHTDAQAKALVAEYNKFARADDQRMATTLQDVREAFGDDLAEMFPRHSIEEYRRMSAERLNKDVTPAERQIAQAMAKYLRNNPSEMSKAQRAKLSEQLQGLKDLGKQLGINKGAWTLDDAAEVFDLIDTATGNPSAAVQAVLMEVNGAKRLDELVRSIMRVTDKPELKALAQKILDHGVSGVTINYEPTLMEGQGPAGLRGWKRGNYNPSTNTITIYAGGETPHIILHETVHALTVQSLRDAKAVTSPKNQREVQLQKGFAQLTELYSYLEQQPELKGEYAFKNLAEFVAEVQSNVRLQAKLAAMPAPEGVYGGSKLKSLLHAFVTAIRNLLGLTSQHESALQQALALTDGMFAGNVKSEPAGEYDALSSPLDAVDLPFQAAKTWFRSVDRSLDKSVWSTMTAAKRKAALYVSSTKHIMRMIANDPALKDLDPSFKDFFTADTNKTQVMKMVGDEVFNSHLRPIELELAKTKNPVQLRQMMGHLAGESSRLNVDLTKDFAGNKATNPKLEDSLKEAVDQLHRDYTRLKQQHPKLAEAIHGGVKLNRKLYAMQTATLIMSMLRSHQKSSQTSAAATNLLKDFQSRLDILQPTDKLTNANPAMFTDALSSTLDAAIRDVFAAAGQNGSRYAHGDIADDLKVVQKFYQSAWDAPYMHLGRHGMYTISFDVADNGTQTTAKLNQLLGKFGKSFGAFTSGQKHVFIRVENPHQMAEIYRVMSENPQLLGKDEKDRPALKAGPISDATALDNAFGLSKLARSLRERMTERYSQLAQSAKTPETKAAFDQAIHALNETLIDMLEVNSARKANQRRAGVPGYDTDYVRNFAKRAQWAESMISNQYVVDDFSDAFRGMQSKINDLQSTNPQEAMRGQEVHDELAKRFANSLNPVDSPIIDGVRSLGYNFYLALSPAFLITNLMQPYHLTLPLLGGRHGFIKSAKEMGRSTAKAVKVINATIKAGWNEGWRGVLDAKLDLSKAGLSADETKFVEHLLRSGVVDFTQAHELGRMAEGGSSSAATAAKAASSLSHYSEVTNRLTAGLAAFNLAKGDFDQRTRYAIEAVEKTQFNYSDHNTARALGRHGMFGKVTPLFTAFQQYAFQTMEHYVRMVHEGFINKHVPKEERAAARKALYGTLATTSLIAGTMGLPFATVLAAAANAGGDDKDARERYREWLNEIFGKDLGEMVAKGATRSLGIDVSSRAGHQDLLPGSRFLADRRAWDDKLKDQSKTLLGPALNAGMDIYTGLLHAAEGDVAKGIEMALPLAIRGAYKAAVAADEGAWTNKSGNQIPIPVTWQDLAVQSLGFTPAKKAEQSEASFYYQSEQGLRKQDKAKAQREFVRAVENGDVTPEVLAKVSEYNLENPDDPLRHLGSLVASRRRGAMLGEISGTGIIDANKKHFPRMLERTWANTGVGEQ